jgi:predicted site-specific integrase-resolvase
MYKRFYRQQETIGSTLALRPRDAAAAISVSQKTLERLTKAGEIQSVLVGRCRLYELSVLENFLKSRRTAGEEVAV